MDPCLGELVLRVYGFWIASGGLFVSPVTSGFRISVYCLEHANVL